MMHNRLQEVLLLALLAILAAASPAAGYLLVLENGHQIGIKDFRFVGDEIEALLNDGKTWRADADDVDYKMTFMANLEDDQEKGVYLARGKVVTFEEIELDEESATLILSETAEITIPLTTIDFKTTVIEGRGHRAGAPVRSIGTGATTPRGGRGRPTPPRGGRSQRPPALPRPPEPVPPHEAEPMPDPGLNPPQRMEGPAFGEAFRNQEGASAPDRAATGRRITRAEVVQKVDPVFDPEMVPEGRGLTALMEVTVTTAGTVGNVKVIKSTGNPELDSSGVEAINQYIYNPAEKDGVPFESRRLERITFRRAH